MSVRDAWQVAVMECDGAAMGEALAERDGERHRAVLATGATDGKGESGAPFGLDER